MTTIPALFKKIVAANDLYDEGALNCEPFLESLKLDVQSDVNHNSALFSGIMTVCLVAVFAYTLVGYVV